MQFKGLSLHGMPGTNVKDRLILVHIPAYYMEIYSATCTCGCMPSDNLNHRISPFSWTVMMLVYVDNIGRVSHLRFLSNKLRIISALSGN